MLVSSETLKNLGVSCSRSTGPSQGCDHFKGISVFFLHSLHRVLSGSECWVRFQSPRNNSPLLRQDSRPLSPNPGETNWGWVILGGWRVSVSQNWWKSAENPGVQPWFPVYFLTNQAVDSSKILDQSRFVWPGRSNYTGEHLNMGLASLLVSFFPPTWIFGETSKLSTFILPYCWLYIPWYPNISQRNAFFCWMAMGQNPHTLTPHSWGPIVR